MEKSTIAYIIGALVAGLGIGIAIGWGLFQTGTKKTDIKMKIGNNELSINLDQDLQDNAAILNKLFSEDFARAGTIEWLRNQKQLFSVKDLALLKPIEEMDYDDVIAQKLRELSFARVGPWAYQIDTIRIGIPPKDYRPAKGEANVCENGKYRDKRLRIFSIDQSNYIEVKANQTYECPPGFKYPDVQLSPASAFELLGRTKFSKFEDGLALILVPK